jgi:hypothetical protein
MSDDKAVDRGDDFKPEDATTGDTLGDTGDQDKVIDKAAGEEAAKELGVETPEAKAEREAKEKEAAEKKEPAIPKSRFDQAVKKAREATEAAEERAKAAEAQLRAQMGQADETKLNEQIEAKEIELDKVRADGNTEKAAQLRKEIRDAMQQISDSRAAAHAARATAVAVEQVRYTTLVSQMEIEHPELNPDLDETYDADVVAELNEYKTAFEALGYASTDALKKALKAVYKDGPKPEAKEGKPEETAEEKVKAEAAAKAASERKEAAVKHAVDTGKKQPAAPGKTGIDSDKAGQQGKQKPVSKMTDKEWDALPEDERKRLRGDSL